MTLFYPQCIKCKNVFKNGPPENCKAFPKRIPEEIITGDFDHRNPYPNAEHPTDNGIRFEPIKE